MKDEAKRGWLIFVSARVAGDVGQQGFKVRFIAGNPDKSGRVMD